ncbi:MAG: tRNA pseudouridine(55) synthase TruB [Clostridia bacterium]|nr:tRNA pseudouridine(55) synthase TruB [Clostridia bacterium]
MDGIINVYKEKGFTSHDVVAKLRGILHIKKIGHTGTLDPDAVGVLPVCIGKGTKLCDMITDTDKTYEAVMLLGISTDTQDISGNVLSKKDVAVDEKTLIETVDSFVGEYKQIPPMYSAIKVNGRKLYQLAREGIEIERSPRDVYIRSIHINDMNLQDGEPSVTMTVSCSKGTYIRTLCHDIGEKLGCGACMKSLSRTRVGRFYIDDSFTINQIAALNLKGELSSIVAPVDSMFDYPRIQINKEYDKLLYNGNLLPLSAGKALDVGLADKVRIYNESGEFIGIYSMDDSGYKPVKIFSAVDAYNDKELRGGV